MKFQSNFFHTSLILLSCKLTSDEPTRVLQTKIRWELNWHISTLFTVVHRPCKWKLKIYVLYTAHNIYICSNASFYVWSHWRVRTHCQLFRQPRCQSLRNWAFAAASWRDNKGLLLHRSEWCHFKPRRQDVILFSRERIHHVRKAKSLKHTSFVDMLHSIVFNAGEREEQQHNWIM